MVVSPIIAVSMVILNVSILSYLFMRVRQDKRRKFVYFINLSLSDSILGLIVLMVKVMVKVEKSAAGGDGGSDLALLREIRIFFQMKFVSLSLYISVLSMAAILVERLILVMYPLYYTRLAYRTKCCLCVMMWIASASAVTLMHFYVKNDRLEYILTPSLALLTMALATISFYLIRKRLRLQRILRVRKITRAERQFTRFCFQTFLLFVVCWFPISVFGILFSSGTLSDWRYLLEFRYTCHVMAFANSFLSPLLFMAQLRKRQNSKENRSDTVVIEQTVKELYSTQQKELDIEEQSC